MKAKNYFIHLIYAGSFLLSVIFIVSYLAWSKDHMATKQAAVEKDKKIQIANCIAQSQQSYAANWAQLCKKRATSVASALADCINSSQKSAKFITSGGADYDDLYQSYAAQCKTIYGTPNPQPDCLLPTSIAKDLNKDLEKNEQMCVTLIA